MCCVEFYISSSKKKKKIKSNENFPNFVFHVFTFRNEAGFLPCRLRKSCECVEAHLPDTICRKRLSSWCMQLSVHASKIRFYH